MPRPMFNALKNPMRMVTIIRLVLVWIRIYFAAQKKTDVKNARVIETPVDDRIAPAEQAIYPYLFACVYILYVGWHMLDKLSRESYGRAHQAYLAMIHEAESVFLSRPTRMRDRDRTSHPLTRFTQTIDGPTNCFPSLHVALVLLSYQIIKDGPDTDPLLLSAMKRSCVDICRSTMQTKQHSVIDVIGGIALTQKTYQTHFEGRFEDLLEEILPELDDHERSAARKAVLESDGLAPLMERLLAQFRNAP